MLFLLYCQLLKVMLRKFAMLYQMNESGYRHQTVNHSRNFVNPRTGFHTQAIERAWVDAKSLIKRARGAGPLLQSHLDECSWRKSRRQYPGGLLNAFWADVKKVFSVSHLQ